MIVHDPPRHAKMKGIQEIHALFGETTPRFLVITFNFNGMRLLRGPLDSFRVIVFRHTGHVPLVCFPCSVR
jgi:hypothetical protein